jgi:general secretion pathway protein I
MPSCRTPTRRPRCAAGFTLVEVLVALMVVAIGLAALMVAVSGTARTSGVLRDKTIAEWIALNRIAEVRLNLTKNGQNTDTGELDFANRKWHYDTRYFDTSITSMKRIVVRVYAGDAKTKGNPLIETVGFSGTQLSPPGSSNASPGPWTAGSGPVVAATGNGTNTSGGSTPVITPGNSSTTTTVPTATGTTTVTTGTGPGATGTNATGSGTGTTP